MSLLDDLDLLSPNSSNATKKPTTKTPQSFLGENSALVNLDNLIKPAAPNTFGGTAAYNPFSDSQTQVPQKNLFQQNQPQVSINIKVISVYFLN